MVRDQGGASKGGHKWGPGKKRGTQASPRASASAKKQNSLEKGCADDGGTTTVHKKKPAVRRERGALINCNQRKVAR